MKLRVTTDFGNSKTKMRINGERIDQPSVIKRVHSPQPVSETDIEKNIANLLDELSVNIVSPSLKRSGFFSVGQHANLDALKSENMNIKLGRKSKHDIPVVMNLSLTAAQAVKQYYNKNKKLPEKIEVQGTLSGAIPASEYTSEIAKEFEERFLGNEEFPIVHVVIVYVGSQSVTVTIKYTHAKITQEGIPALYALLEADDSILNKFKELYQNEPKRFSMTQRDFLSLKGLGVDIGAGTTEYIHSRGINPVLQNCHGEKRGVGHAAEEATKLLESELNGHLKINRQRFDEIMQDPLNNYHDLAQKFMSEAQYGEANKILEDVQERYSTIGGDIDFMMVFGGGSITFEEDLYPALIEFSEDIKCMILWIPKEFAIDMNLDGLEILHTKVFFPGVA
ncbi:plasmid segregation protein ParM [Paenibacillus amylolyticus]|uniref:Plasmid segregation protein ParM n=1 Tax=Paenibacillus amylolyticus TaxID=1451 RepID=A0AAP5H931_PAEAM|nr:plasmid segregation protein ParM [Paenibacillus amylolyticus]